MVDNIMEMSSDSVECLRWTAKAAMGTGIASASTDMWLECFCCLSSCSFICHQLRHCGQKRIGEGAQSYVGLDSTYNLKLAALPMSVHALLWIYREFDCVWQHQEDIRNSLHHPLTWQPLVNADIALKPAPATCLMQSILAAAKDILSQCHEIVPTMPPPPTNNVPLPTSFLNLDSLGILCATFACDEAAQKVHLKSILARAELRGRDLEDIAAICLETDKPWKNSGMGCALLGLALRTEHQRPQPDFLVIARVRTRP